DLPVHDPAHDVSHAAVGARQLAERAGQGAFLLRAHAHPHDGDAGRVHGARSALLLRDVGADARADVLHHRRLGRRTADLREHQVLHLHVSGIAAHARGDPVSLVARAEYRDAPVELQLRLPHAACPHRITRGPLAVRSVLRRLRGEGADVPAAHLAAGRAYGGADGRLRDPGGYHAENGNVRLSPVRPAAVPG